MCARMGAALVVSGIHTQPLVALEHSGAIDVIGRDRVFAGIEPALKLARHIVETKPV